MFHDNLLLRAPAIVRAAPMVLKGVMFPFSQSLVVSCVVNFCAMATTLLQNNASVLACS